MKNVNLIVAALLLFVTTSCGHYADGTSVWAGGTWILLVIGIAGTIGTGIYGYFQTKSGSERLPAGTNDPGQPNLPNMKFWQVRGGQFCIILFILTIALIVVQNWNK